MKKIFLGLTLIVGTLTFAQQKTSAKKTPSSPITFGIKAGLNVSSVSNLDAKARAGFYGGAFANIPVAKDFSVQPEVLYSAQGAKGKSNSDVRANLDYINVPIMFQYNALPNLYLEAGPQFGFLVNSKVKIGPNNSTTETINVKDYTKTFDFGLGLGAGYYFTPNIGVNVRYVAGLTDVLKNDKGNSSRRNGVFQVGLAYKFL
jgi:opacity protein-like surface antigen